MFRGAHAFSPSVCVWLINTLVDKGSWLLVVAGINVRQACVCSCGSLTAVSARCVHIASSPGVTPFLVCMDCHLPFTCTLNCVFNYFCIITKRNAHTRNLAATRIRECVVFSCGARAFCTPVVGACRDSARKLESMFAATVRDCSDGSR